MRQQHNVHKFRISTSRLPKEEREEEDSLEHKDLKVRAAKNSTPAIIAPLQILTGPQGVTAGGVTYIRWGRTTCNSTAGTQLLYSGITAGSFFDDTGGGANHLCLPDEDPEFLNVTDGVQSSRARLYGTEYEAEQNPPNFGAMEEHNVPCAVCYTPTRGTMIMIPAKVNCPTSWTREYYGYLMSAQYNTPHRRTMFECVDSDAESVPGSGANDNGAVLYFTEARCNGIACPPYEDGKELACTVCTK